MHKIVFSPEAEDDLRSLFIFIAERSGETNAQGYLSRIEAFCRSFALFPLRGRSRDDLSQGLRIIGFERRVTIAFHVENECVIFDRILYGGRSLDPIFGTIERRGKYSTDDSAVALTATPAAL